MVRTAAPVRLGLRANLAQFALLVGVNALVGGMIGQERTVLPLLAERVFHLHAFTAALTFIVAFGAVKAVTNFAAGTLSDRVGELWSALQDVAATHVAGLEKLAAAYLGDRDGVEVIDREELTRRLERGEVVVLDVRPEAEYTAGHIAGARSLPVGELRRQLRSFPKDADVVAYCRGPYCVYADDAVRELNRKGFRARRLIDGFPEWKRAGLPVAAGNGDNGDG